MVNPGQKFKLNKWNPKVFTAQKASSTTGMVEGKFETETVVVPESSIIRVYYLDDDDSQNINKLGNKRIEFV